MYNCGQEIMRCQPFIYAIKSEYRNKICDWCLKLKNEVESLKPCTKCLYVHYCSKSCQTSAWKSHHRFECKISFWFTRSENKLKRANQTQDTHNPIANSGNKLQDYYTVVYRNNICVVK